MSYAPPNQNYPGGGNSNYNQPQQPGTFGPPHGQGLGQGGNPPGAGYGQQQQGYGAPPGQGPPGNSGYPAPPTTYSQQPSAYAQNNPTNSYQSNTGGSLPPQGQGYQSGPPMGTGPPSSMGQGTPNTIVQPPVTNRATFFSTASGAPIPSGSAMNGPPSSGTGMGMGGMPAPPGYQGKKYCRDMKLSDQYSRFYKMVLYHLIIHLSSLVFSFLFIIPLISISIYFCLFMIFESIYDIKNIECICLEFHRI